MAVKGFTQRFYAVRAQAAEPPRADAGPRRVTKAQDNLTASIARYAPAKHKSSKLPMRKRHW
jgi:hypothetical protein